MWPQAESRKGDITHSKLARTGKPRLPPNSQKDANTEGEVSWQVPNWESEGWSAADWNSTRWLLRVSSPSILDVAVGNVSMVQGAIGQNDIVLEALLSAMLGGEGVTPLNKDGGSVTIRTPESRGEAFDTARLSPHPGVVAALLSHNVRITQSAVEKARKNGDQGIMLLLLAGATASLTISSGSGSSPNDRLIDAIEARRTDLVRSALQSGADPNTRKSVTLRVGAERSDTTMGESALALAVLYMEEDMVRELLDRG